MPLRAKLVRVSSDSKTGTVKSAACRRRVAKPCPRRESGRAPLSNSVTPTVADDAPPCQAGPVAKKTNMERLEAIAPEAATDGTATPVTALVANEGQSADVFIDTIRAGTIVPEIQTIEIEAAFGSYTLRLPGFGTEDLGDLSGDLLGGADDAAPQPQQAWPLARAY